MAKKAVLTGKITRVAKLCGSGRTELSIDVRETKIDQTTFTLGTDISCAVPHSTIHDAQTNRVCTVAAGDKVTIEAENVKNSWVITAIKLDHPNEITIVDYLKSLEEELAGKN